MGAGGLLGAGGAGHEGEDGGVGRLAAAEDGVHLLDDGHADVVLAGQGQGGGAGVDAFGDLDHAAEDGLEGFAASEAFANGVVAAGGGEAGDHEVADAGEAGEGFGAGAHGDAEAGHFGEAPGDEGAFGIVAVAESVADAGGESDDVLEGSAELDAGDIGGGVGAEGGAVEEGLEKGGGGGGGAGDGDGGGHAAGGLGGQGGAGEDGGGGDMPEVADGLGGAAAGGLVEALGGNDDGGASGGLVGGLEVPKGGGGELAGDDEDDGLRARHHFRGVGGPAEVAVEGDVGEEAGVAAGGGHLGEIGGVRSPDGDGMGVAGEDEGQGGAPAAIANDG